MPSVSHIAVIGLGYVGLPLVVEFGKHVRTIGFDISQRYFLLRRDAPPASAEDYVNSRMQAQVSMQQQQQQQ
jgi:UDP-N-acetyl-D-mannosaminuronate dehydrogenase